MLVNLSLERNTCRLMEDPEFITRGFVHAKEADELFDSARGWSSNPSTAPATAGCRQDLEQTLKSFFYSKTKRRPMVFVTMSQT